MSFSVVTLNAVKGTISRMAPFASLRVTKPSLVTINR